MSLFRNSFYNDVNDVSFGPVFRFIDAFDNYRGANNHTSGDVVNTNKTAASNKPSSLLHIAPTFSPRFDVVETKDAYELHGEIPGAARDNISIEFTEPQTIVVSGRIERTRAVGSDDDDDVTPPATPTSEKSYNHRATVADEEEEERRERGEVAVTQQPEVAAKKPAKDNGHRFWVRERSIGSFTRTFKFPVRVDEANVKASLNEGVLKVVIPKQERPVNHRIDIL